jgi:molecular chaperone DnaK
MIFQTEKQLKEFGDKLSEGNKTAINSALEKLKEAHKTQDGAAIDTALAGINAAWQAASQEMYAAGGNQAGANPGAGANQGESNSNGSAGAGGSEATDVEYEEVKDKK